MSVLDGFRFIHHNISLINVRKYRWDNQKQTIQRNWQYRVHKTQDENKPSKTQYVFGTTMRKKTQIKY